MHIIDGSRRLSLISCVELTDTEVDEFSHQQSMTWAARMKPRLQPRVARKSKLKAVVIQRN
jgi:hypothetical protein